MAKYHPNKDISKAIEMHTWNFIMDLKGIDDVTDELAESLYAEFQDGTLSC